jgi:hypothetical protein
MIMTKKGENIITFISILVTAASAAISAATVATTAWGIRHSLIVVATWVL